MSGNLVDAEIKIYFNEKSGYDIELLRENSRFRQLKFQGKESSSVY